MNAQFLRTSNEAKHNGSPKHSFSVRAGKHSAAEFVRYPCMVWNQGLTNFPGLNTS